MGAMDFNEAVSFLDDAISYGIKPDISRITALLGLLGNPQDSLSIIHVTGTNGKTTTCRMITSILKSHGLKTGLYTSPHLISVTERIEIDGPISTDMFARTVEDIAPYVGQVNSNGNDNLTYFEILTAMAFYVFHRERVDCAVIEVGMGGRWDATNAANGQVAVLTNVGSDHAEYLGHSALERAAEKAHIIKPGGAAITGETDPSVLTVIKNRCNLVNVPLSVIGRDFDVTGSRDDFMIRGMMANYEGLKTGLFGQHQLQNAALAVTACESYLEDSLDPVKLKSAILATASPGRFEVMRRDPLLVLDGAHNTEGVEALTATLDDNGLDYDRLIVVLAVLSDKDYERMVTFIAKRADVMVLAKNSSERCLPPERLVQIVDEMKVEYVVKQDIKEALELALSLAHPEDMILVTGSLYTVADARAILMKG